MPINNKYKYCCSAVIAILMLTFTYGCLSTVQARDLHMSYYERAKIAYRSAWNSYKKLSRSYRLRRYRTSWIKVIRSFDYIYRHYYHVPSIASKSLFMTAKLYKELYGYSHRKRDILYARDRYIKFLKEYPRLRLAEDALYNLALCYIDLHDNYHAERILKKFIAFYPKNPNIRSAKRKLAELTRHKQNKYTANNHYRKNKYYIRKKVRTVSGEPVAPKIYKAETGPKISRKAKPIQVLAIRHWSTTDYTRIVIDTSGPASYHLGYLRANIRRHLPKRLYLDIVPASISHKLPKLLEVHDGLLKAIRTGQYRHKIVRVVFDLGKFKGTRIFYLDHPFRIVVDIFGSNYAPINRYRYPKIPSNLRNLEKGHPLSLAQQLGLCVRRIVIDPGHGGKDPGAIGPDGLEEKNVVLKVAKKVAQILRKKLGCQVILTRKRDVFLPLEERTAIANANKADIFVSIHANSSPNRHTHGVETFFLNLALDKNAMRIAARENATSTKGISDLQNILTDLMRNSKIRESKRLAQYVQTALVTDLRKKYRDVSNLGVRQAPFFVLIGARMPAILTEISFISNYREEKRLESNRYLDQVAKGIADGIISYAEATETAYNTQHKTYNRKKVRR